MKDQFPKVNESVAFLRDHARVQPDIGIVLGTGLSRLADRFEAAAVFPYQQVPHFPVSTVAGHRGRLVFGSLAGKAVMALQGRFHFYEGYDPKEITFPIRVMAAMGVRTLVISNAAGGLNPLFRPGDLMLIRDHINLTGQNPLRGENVDAWGPRFPDMTEPYTKSLVELAEQVALELGLKVHQGVYVGVSGPSMETAAETRFLRLIGADAVGMSTIPEVIAAVHAGLRVLGVSVITNVNLPDNYQPAPIDKVIATAESAEPRLERLMTEVLRRM
ncbi:MAG TPA: purine-nucleoside phosphorylase [Syntrophobacteria bacterium]|nr:purine-nucleoside phosphorylase [Syntrophobacteria bacterium]